MENNLIIVTDWEKVEADDYYLSKEWAEHTGEDLKEARKLQKQGELYVGYLVDAKNYAIYWQMDADMVLIDSDCNIIVFGESHVIGNNHEHREEATI